MTRMSDPTARRLAITLAVLAALVIAIVIGLRVATQQLQSRLVQTLGPRASIGELSAGWTGIEVRELRIKAPPGWPAADELRAERVRVVPDLRSLFGGPWPRCAQPSRSTRSSASAWSARSATRPARRSR